MDYTYMTCVDGAMLADPGDEYDEPGDAMGRAHDLKGQYPDSVVSVVLVAPEPA